MYFPLKTILKNYIYSYTGFSLGVWLNVFAGFVNAMGNVVSIFMALYLTTQLHLTNAQVGSVIAINGMGLVLGSYFGGYLCDRINTNQVAYWSLIGSGLAVMVYPFLHLISLILTISLLMGLAYGTFRPANTLTLFANCQEIDRAQVNSLYRVGANLGMGFGAAVGGFLTNYDYHLIYWLNAITCFMSAFILFFFANIFKIPTVYKTASNNFKENIKNILSNKFFMCLCFLLVINMLIFMQIRAPYEMYLQQQYHISTKIIGYLFFLNNLLIVLFEVPIMNALKNSNQILLAMTGSLFTAIGMFILPFGNSLFLAFLSCIIWTLGQILFSSPMFVLAMRGSTKELTGTYMGIYQAMFSFSLMLAPALGLLIYTKEQGAFIWHICGVLGLISLLGFYGLNEAQRRSNLVLPLN